MITVSKENSTYRNNEKASEPERRYKKIQIFNSFSEAETATILETLKQTPEERISETVNLIRRVYKDKLERTGRQAPENKIRWKARP